MTLSWSRDPNCCFCNESCAHTGPHNYCTHHSWMTSTNLTSPSTFVEATFQSELVQVGKYTIENSPHGGVWLSKNGGEGMQVLNTLDALEKLLDEFWEENF